MNSKLTQPWITAEHIENLVQLEPALMIVGLIFAAAVIYKLFLRQVSEERHQNLHRLFTNLGLHLLVSITTFSAYYSINHMSLEEGHPLQRIAIYFGLLTILSWCIVFVKVCRIILFEYLFISHMNVGVPLLLVNLFSLLLTLVLAGWLSTELFAVKIGPLLATSAIFSLVLGLALQDTLGNLFAGVAMQFDKPYEIGDWIEITLNNQKWVGQVDEISWRATVLVGLSDESISVPNRMMGQTQISNFSHKIRPICRSQIFRIAHGQSAIQAKEVLLRAVIGIPHLLSQPAPIAFVFESTDSWVGIKLVYSLDNFSRQFGVGDQVIIAGNEALCAAGFDLAPQRILIMRSEESDPTSLDETAAISTQTLRS